MRLLFLVFFSVLHVGIVHSQQDAGSGGNFSQFSGHLEIAAPRNHIVSQQLFDDAFAGKYSVDDKYHNIEGDPFLTKEAVKSTLVMNNGSMIKDVLLQIDLYTNDVIATTAKEEEVYLNKKHFQEMIIPIDGEDIVFRKINPDSPDQFYELLYIDPNTVFFKKRFVTRKEPLSNGINRRPASFTKRSEYYLKRADGPIEKIKVKKKQIFEHFDADQVDQMKAYAKAHDIKLKDEYDFAKVFRGVFQH